MKNLIAVVGLLAGLVVFAVADSPVRNSIKGTGARRDTVEFQWVEPTAGSAMNMVPGVTNTNARGTSSLRWSDVQTTNLTVAGTLTASGGLTVAGGFVIPTVDIAASSPTVLGQLVKTTGYVIYVATNVTDVNGWVKVGGQ
jgi:hypothetical protein